jgi:hypothetical protein
MTSIVVIRPEDQQAARDASRVADRLVLAIASSNHNSRELRGGRNQVTRAEVEASIPGASLVLYVGHGEADALVGATRLIDVDNIRLAAGSLFVAIACHSAARLGPQAILHGVDAYLGWETWLTLLTPSVYGDPFGEALEHAFVDLFQGISIGRAAQSLSLELHKVVDFYRSGPGSADPNAVFGAVFAYWDANHLVVRGDGSASILAFEGTS